MTSIAFILPLAFWLQFILPEMAFLVLLHILPALVGFLFILDFPLRKPGLRGILILIGVVAVTVGIIFAFTKFRVPNSQDESNQIVDELIEGIYETQNP